MADQAGKPIGGTWKRRSTCQDVSTSVEVDLDEFSTEQLLQELIDRDVITEGDAVAIVNADPNPLAARPCIAMLGPADELRTATHELRSGRRGEALIHIERFLGSEWIGRLS